MREIPSNDVEAQIAADQYNDQEFDPSSMWLPDLHDDFSNTIDHSATKAPIPITPGTIKKLGRLNQS